MTVQELIDTLGSYPADFEVWIEDECCGCSSKALDVIEGTPTDYAEEDYPAVVVISG